MLSGGGIILFVGYSCDSRFGRDIDIGHAYTQHKGHEVQHLGGIDMTGFK